MIQKIASIIFVLHFLALGSYIISKHSNLQLPQWLDIYVGIYFPQEWEMFAPPPQSNTLLYYRFAACTNGQCDTSQFQEVLQPLYQHQKSDIASLGRLSYYLFNTTQDIHNNHANYLENLPDSIPRADEKRVMAYVNGAMATSFGHQSLIKHGQLLYQAHHPQVAADSVLFSYHIIHEKIPDYHQRYEENNVLNFEETYWNSPFYKIID